MRTRQEDYKITMLKNIVSGIPFVNISENYSYLKLFFFFSVYNIFMTVYIVGIDTYIEY